MISRRRRQKYGDAIASPSFKSMIISYLKYRRKAQGKYHLHSPLVFSLYEEVLEKTFTSSFRAKSRNHRHLNRSELYAGDLFTKGECSRFARVSIPLRFSRNDNLFYEALDKNLKDFVNDNPLIFNENDVVMIVKDIHRGKQNERDWERLVGDEKVRLSIDCWRFGMIFVMERIKKEHYILKV